MKGLEQMKKVNVQIRDDQRLLVLENSQLEIRVSRDSQIQHYEDHLNSDANYPIQAYDP